METIAKSANLLSKTYYYGLAQIRKSSGSTSLGFVKAVLETAFTFALMIGIMLLIRGAMGRDLVRVPFLWFIFSGVALFITHNQIFKAISTIKKTDPMLPVLSISRGVMIFGQVLNAVYMQTVVNLLFIAILFWWYGPIPIQSYTLAFYIYFLCIAWSIAMGALFMSITPLAPFFFMRLGMVYRRAGIVTSGKMIPGNLLGMMGRFGGIFMINPLFHIIDQFRGALFTQYNPFISNLQFPIQMTILFLALAMIFYFAFNKAR